MDVTHIDAESAAIQEAWSNDSRWQDIERRYTG